MQNVYCISHANNWGMYISWWIYWYWIFFANNRAVCITYWVSLGPSGHGWGMFASWIYVLVLYISYQQLGNVCQLVNILILDIFCQQSGEYAEVDWCLWALRALGGECLSELWNLVINVNFGQNCAIWSGLWKFVKNCEPPAVLHEKFSPRSCSCFQLSVQITTVTITK